ncbi:PREDICTED: unconventional myosin-Va [Vollenhovia emeryi]|uniref:unconventional myosin-Va n=1 Tax=Vollenhovia emeryi TaxID=411798 RepID=UPI0005F3BC42|nr:PREDICTED: unconventional myosin-Va [Vollenhovia emeryi]
MTTRELYVKDGRVWVPHPEKVWEGAVLLENYRQNQRKLKVRTEESKQTRELEIKSDNDLPPLRNPDILIGENNLTSLSFLHEPAVLYNLQIRFQRHSIYTYCGIVLVAFNPYNELPIYGNDTIWAYRGQAMGDLEPHIFAVAEEAYTKLERENHDQSIIVSGESGAGKTVSAKYTMRYFATVGGSATETQIEKKVLASSPIMEAIGNAKTTRNDNSSRFGKFIEIQFNKNYHITGASMRTYLLEKSRVVFQANEERNYHIFYQMCSAAKRLPQLHLSDQGQFHYLNQGNNPRIDGVDDLVYFDETISALTMLGFTSKQQDDMLRILAAILHLGNVDISSCVIKNAKDGEVDTESSHISPSDRHLLVLSELLGVEVSALRKWLCHRKIVSTREVFLKPMTVEQAIGARDALAKHIYAELFNWIVTNINSSLQSPYQAHCFIGVLDIYGFETFEINSFEQFCINYANEKLQQQFNQHVFKLEQEEYLKEDIEWTFIDFYDNQPCIDLIETKLGILDLLDEECRMPKGSDASWAEKLYTKCIKSKHFEKPRFGTSAFLIHHFADLVQYETVGFLEKNRDTVIEEQVDVLRSGKNKLLRRLFSEEDPKLTVPHTRVKVSAQKIVPTSAANKQNKKTVGSQFRDSLNMLMATLNATTLGLQRYGRGYIARRKAEAMRRERAAVKIQARVKGWLQRRWYLQVKRTILGLQTRGRGNMARARFRLMKDNAAATVIQRFARGYLVRMACKRRLRDIITVQSCIRKRQAKKVFRRLKAEARSVEHVKSLNKGLEMKIITLQQKINEMAKGSQLLKNVQNEMIDLKCKLESLKSVDAENKKLNGVVQDKERELKKMEETLQREKDEKMDILHDKERSALQKDAENRKLQEENERLRKELSIATEKLKSNQRGAEENLKYRLEQEKDLLMLEQDQDRGAYQRLLKDYHELEQHAEMVEQKLLLQGVLGHSRSLSNASSGSGQITSTENPQDDQNADFGYGSVRSTGSSSTPYSRVETIDWNQQRSDSPPDGEVQPNKSEAPAPAHAPVDIGLVLKLQQKLRDVEKEKGRLIRRVEDLERDSSEDSTRTQDSFKLQELEMENAQLKKDLNSLRKTVSSASPSSAQQNLMMQFEALQEELERRREECIQLHSVLADHTRRMKNLGANYGRDVDIINEDGELVLAFEAQKKINRQLEDELQAKERSWRAQRDEWRNEIDRLQEEIEKQQKLLSINLSKSPQTQAELYMQYEVARLASENLELQEKYDKLADECRRFKKQCKILAKQLMDAGYECEERFSYVNAVPNAVEYANGCVALSGTHGDGSNMPIIRKKERDYEGMFEFKKEDINVIIRHMVIELKPRIAVTLLPGLPAYILFMCIRHTDCINDDEKVRSLLTEYLNAVKRVLKKRDDFDSRVLWLSNTLRLLHNMKQYSGDKPFQIENTPRQNEQCLRNFDLSEYRVVLSNVALWIFNNLITNLKERIQALTVPALLEHEAISVPTDKAGRPRSSSMGGEPDSTQQKLDKLLGELTSVHKTLQYHGVDPEVVVQLFKQLFYFMCASALNNLLLRSELCRWTKGMQIRYNMSHLEQWGRDRRLETASEALQPIIQASQLLQARKTDEDVNSVCEMCNKLTANQIVKILNLYTPVDDYESRVPVSFIKKVQDKLKERGENNEQLLMDLKYSYPVRFSFNPSDIRLEDIEVPEVLQLPMLKKV